MAPALSSLVGHPRLISNLSGGERTRKYPPLTLTDEEKQGAHAFLKFLSTYKPTGLNVREPDFYGYGDAFGQYGVTYFDKQTLEDYGIDPDKLDAPQLDQLMTRWTEEAYDMLSGDGCDIIPDSLDNAIKTLGIDRESIEA